MFLPPGLVDRFPFALLAIARDLPQLAQHVGQGLEQAAIDDLTVSLDPDERQ